MDDDDLETELGVGGFDAYAPVVAEMREKISNFAENCANRIIASFSKRIIAKIEEAEKLDDFKEKMIDCFKARHGAYILGAEQIQEADEDLFKLLDSLCYNDFSLSALSDNISHYYLEAMKQPSSHKSFLTTRAEEAGASTKAHR